MIQASNLPSGDICGSMRSGLPNKTLRGIRGGFSLVKATDERRKVITTNCLIMTRPEIFHRLQFMWPWILISILELPALLTQSPPESSPAKALLCDALTRGARPGDRYTLRCARQGSTRLSQPRDQV